MEKSYKYEVVQSKNTKGWEDFFTTGVDRVNTSSQAYALVPLVFRALRLRCDALVSAPILVENAKSGKEAKWPFVISPKRMLWLSQAGLLTMGAAYWLKRDRAGIPGRTAEISYLNPTYVQVTYSGGIINFHYSGQDGSNTYTQDKVAYLKEYNPADDILPGPSSMAVGIQDSAMLRYVTRFAAKYFEGGAMPVTIVQVETGDTAEIERVSNWFKNMATGISQAWKSFGTRAKIDPKTITPPLDTLQMPELTTQARANLALAFGIPQTMLEDAANFATAKEHRLSFYNDTVEPNGEMIVDELNEQLLKPMGIALRIDWQGLDIYQEDEQDRASSLVQLVNAGIPLDMATDILGYDFDEEQKARLVPEPAPVAQAQPAQADEFEDEEAAKYAADLLKFQRKALKSIGKSVSFESDSLPPNVITAIQSELPACDSPDGVRAVFAKYAHPKNDESDLAMQMKRALDFLENESKTIKYSVDQPRDENGRFSNGGGGTIGLNDTNSSWEFDMMVQGQPDTVHYTDRTVDRSVPFVVDLPERIVPYYERYGGEDFRERAVAARGRSAPDYAIEAHRLGAELRAEGYTSYRSAIGEAIHRGFEGDTLLENVCLEAGLTGAEMPYPVVAWRYGNIPDGGASYNRLTQGLEAGTSVMGVFGGGHTQDMLSTARMSMTRPIVIVSGYLNTVTNGGDGEPLLIAPKEIDRITP